MNPPKNILLATDFSDASDVAMTFALELARPLDATVHLVHVYTVLNDRNSASYSKVELEQRSQQRLQALASTCSGSTRVGSVLTRFGDPGPTILITAEQLAVDMIVLGTHGRRGVEHFLLGSVAEQVVKQAKCPVLIAKPRTYPAHKVSESAAPV